MPTDKCNGLLALQRINGVDISYRNLSWDTISEVQECLAQISKRQIVDRINESEFYAIMIDESTDISVQKNLSICVRYVVNGESQTEFLANVKIDNGYAHTIVRHLVAKLESLNIAKGKMVSLATDGAAAMFGP